MRVSIEGDSPPVITVRMSGRIGSREWRAALSDVAKLLNPQERTSVLVLADAFDGWEQGDWDDLSFRQEYDPFIDRLAIVADEKWQDRSLMFAGKGLRRIGIEFFKPTEIEKARRWLTSGAQSAGATANSRRDESGDNP
jgi:hypothetical protein